MLTHTVIPSQMPYIKMNVVRILYEQQCFELLLCCMCLCCCFIFPQITDFGNICMPLCLEFAKSAPKAFNCIPKRQFYYHRSFSGMKGKTLILDNGII